MRKMVGVWFYITKMHKNLDMGLVFRKKEVRLTFVKVVSGKEIISSLVKLINEKSSIPLE